MNIVLILHLNIFLDEIVFVDKLEDDTKAQDTGKISAMKKFQTRDTKGVNASDVADTKLNSTHQNQVKIAIFLLFFYFLSYFSEPTFPEKYQFQEKLIFRT